MSKIISLFIFIVSLVFFTGCSRYFQLGANKSYCEEKGCDYSDAGLCKDPYDLFSNIQKYNDEAYNNIDCRGCGNKSVKTIIIYGE